jgi:hypothetical protein
MAATLWEAIDRLARRGFTGHFAVRDNQLRDLDSGRSFEPKDVVIRAFYRFEGVSDPDDMSVVYAIESLSGVRGTLTDAYGFYSNPTISAFVANVPIQQQ